MRFLRPQGFFSVTTEQNKPQVFQPLLLISGPDDSLFRGVWWVSCIVGYIAACLMTTTTPTTPTTNTTYNLQSCWENLETNVM